MDIKILNAKIESKKCSINFNRDIKSLRRRYKSRFYVKTKREKDNKEILELEEENGKLREKNEKYLEAKQVFYFSWDDYVKLYPELNDIMRDKNLEQCGELQRFRARMHAIEELWD